MRVELCKKYQNGVSIIFQLYGRLLLWMPAVNKNSFIIYSYLSISPLSFLFRNISLLFLFNFISFYR